MRCMTYQCRHCISFHPTAREEADINVYIFGPFAFHHWHPPERLILLHGLHCRLPTGGQYKVFLLERPFGRRLPGFRLQEYPNSRGPPTFTPLCAASPPLTGRKCTQDAIPLFPYSKASNPPDKRCNPALSAHRKQIDCTEASIFALVEEFVPAAGAF